MKKQFGMGFIPYESGDLVKIKGSSTTCKIIEIRFVQLVVAKTGYFEVELFTEEDSPTFWIKADQIIKRILPS